MTFFRMIAAIAALGFALNVWALDLDSVRSSGKVKELPTGFLEAADNSGEVKALVKEINEKRKAHYEAVAKKNGTNVGVVGAAAAEKIKEKMGN